jgi:hypothetical protein
VKSSLLDDFRSFFECGHVVPVGSGTVGLNLTLRSLGVRGRPVIIPALTCSAVALAVVAAGGVPRLVDVSSADCTIDPDAVARALDRDVAAIVAVDSFGYPARLRALRTLATPFGCPVIEDACQSYGGRVDGAPLGGLGDVSVVSFGYAKNVWLNGGALVLTDDADLARDVLALQRSRDYAWLSGVRSHVMLRLALAGRENWLPFLARRCGLLRYSFPADQEQRLEAAWHVFVTELEETKGTLVRVAELIAGFAGVQPFDYTEPDWLPWRYSFTIPDPHTRARFITAMAAAGVPLTHLYPVLDGYATDAAAPGYDTARRIAASIVNLKHSARAADTREFAARLEGASEQWAGPDEVPRS